MKYRYNSSINELITILMNQNALISIAPMIDWTYSHFRIFMRILAPQALLYTEMQTTGAVANNPARALCYHSVEHPLALQLGGADPKALSEAAKQAEQAGFDEINLNLGCPSDKVQAGQFGACLMKEPARVEACLQALRQAVQLPVTAKTRIGIDHEDSYAFFSGFAHRLVNAGCQKLIVHARKAWLNGLSPKQNRSIPPVQYQYVYDIKQEFPDLPVVINGSIQSGTEVLGHLSKVDGVMLGRLACDNPYAIAEIHQSVYPTSSLLSRSQILSLYLEYLLPARSQGVSLSILTKPLFNLAHGLPGASLWKQKLMQIMQSKEIALFADLQSYLSEIECQANLIT